MPRLLIDISAHGYGHLSQTAPVLNALGRARPDLALMVRSALPAEQLARRIEVPFSHVARTADFGFTMRDAVSIDFTASAARYREFHANWDARVATYAAELRAAQIDAVFANVGYLPLAAAAAADIPAVAMSSLNWADLCAHYFADEAWAAPILAQMRAAYASARAFLALTPGMMPDFANTRVIGPVATLRAGRRAELAARLGIDLEETWLLLAMGGVELRLPVESWPRLPRVRLLVPAHWRVDRMACRLATTEFSPDDFADLLVSTDVVLTKPGYGTFVEAACHGRAVLYVRRDNWPEENPLAAWLGQHARAAALSAAELRQGRIAEPLENLLAQPLPPPPPATGINMAVTAVLDLLR